MTELVLKGKIDRKKLDSIVNFLRSCNIDVEVKYTTTKKTIKKDAFAGVRGIWTDRDIDAEALRCQAWRIDND